jgi:thiol-disulfide isomerase/thioredoxin
MLVLVILVILLPVIDIIGVGISLLMPALHVVQRSLQRPETHFGVGQKLTSLELEPLTGDPPPLSLSDLQNHVVLLNLWGTWCPPCREELPHMAELRQRFAGQPTFRLLAVSYPPIGQPDDVQSLRKETADLLNTLHVDLPTYCDPGNATLKAVDETIALEGYPTTLLLDRRGVVRAVWAGYRPGVEAEMERFIDAILSEQPAGGRPEEAVP